jgi:hypothetical protein
MISNLVDAHLKYWREFNKDKLDIANTNTQWNTQFKSVFIFQFKGEEVSIKSKPEFYSDIELDSQEIVDQQFLRKIPSYREFFRSVCKKYHLALDFEMAMDVGDVPMSAEPILSYRNPLFAFQKKAFSPEIPLPDVTLIDAKLHENTPDHIPWGNKITKALFVGATTGGNLTQEGIKKLKNERLRNAIYFKDHPLVDVSLTKISQCDEEIKRLILDLGVSGEKLTWRDQYRYKFIISIDGNGATWSRNFIVLKSNSLLMKYASQNQLFYFPKLRPYHHYLPIYTPRDIIYFIEMEKEFSNNYQKMISNAQEFYCQYLTIDSLMDYTSQILIECNQLFGRS